MHVAAEDGSDLTHERASRIRVLATTNPAVAITDWLELNGSVSLTGGLLAVDHLLDNPEESWFYVAREPLLPPAVPVHDVAGLRAAVAVAEPGTRILLAPGAYGGGLYFANLRGEPDRPVVIAGEDPRNPPTIQGGGNGLHLVAPSFVELRDLAFAGASDNGLNIDDGGALDTPARGIVLRGLRVSEVGPGGNHDGIKLSGVDDFRVSDCTVERWGTGGSAIDLVGCHNGVIESNVFRHLPSTASEAANGVQTKGGTRGVTLRRNRFEHAGSRGVNIGGSTGLQFFRPPLPPTGDRWEAKDIVVEGNTFIGAGAPIAFVGVDGAEVRYNTLYRPQRWAIRILQETSSSGFVPCRNGRFTDNIVAFHSSEWSAGGINIGPNTASATFQFARNWWYCLDAPDRSRPSLPVAESGGVYGRSPEFRDEAAGDLRPRPGSPADSVGAEALPE